MNKKSTDNSQDIYRIAPINDDRVFTLTGRALKILIQIDGKKGISEISESINMDVSTINDTLFELTDLGLIEKSEGISPSIGPDFIRFLVENMSIIAGPIAQVLVEDAITEIGRGKDIPLSRAPEIIEILSKQITHRDQKAEFIRSAMRKIKEIEG